jgi:hypothetical protein
MILGAWLSRIASPILFLALCLPAQIAPKVDIHDSFEGRSLSNLWEAIRFVPGSIEMQSNVVRFGHGAVKITLKPGDMFESGANGDADSERDELLES